VLPVRASPTAVLLAAAGTYLVRAAAPLVVSVLISFLAAYALDPIVRVIATRARVSRGVARRHRLVRKAAQC
jgi:predicted PurR-regulated permease PerM